MKLSHTLPGAVALAAAIALVPDGSVRAQDTAQAQPPTIEGITVIAPRITFATETRRRDVGRGSALPVEVTDATEVVPVQGLDLNRTADLFKLEKRVEAAAGRVCTALEQKYPEGEPRREVCVRRALDDAMAQVRRMTQATVVGR